MVIVIDDNVVCALAIQARLSDMHFKNFVVHDAYAALRICAGLQRDIEFIFINLFIPEFNGFELVRDIKNMNREIPVFAYCEKPSKEILQKCRKVGFNGFIQKPINHQRLNKFINDYVTTKDQKGQEYDWD